jgi:tetratricopeptide (TPR) repeat protein
LSIDKKRWRSWNYLIRSNLKQEQFDEAVSNGKTATRMFPDNYEIKLKLSEAYLFTDNHQSALKLLEDTHVLPFEGASVGRRLYEQALLYSAIESYKSGKYDQGIQFLEKAKQWPEYLGVGKPYEPDERLEDYLQAMCLRKLQDNSASKYEEQVVKYTKEHFRGDYRDILGIIIMEPEESTELISSKGIKMPSLADLSKSGKGDLYFEIVEKLVDLRE